MAKVFLNDIRWEYLSDEGRVWLKNHPDPVVTGQVVKESSKRRVVFFPGMYLKEVHYHGFGVLLKSLGSGTACKEGRVSRKLAELGICVPQVIGYGKAASGGVIRRDVLLTREVAGGKSLFDFLHRDFPRLPCCEKRKFVRRFAAYVRKLHDAGALHADLHVGNILLVAEGHEFNFVLLDNDRLSLKRGKISTRQRIQNLALVLSNLRFHFSRTQYLRFLQEYGFPPGEKGLAFLSALESKAFAHINKICYGKAHKCLSNNSRFSKEHRQGFTIYRKSELRTENIIDILLPDPDKVLDRGEVLKAGRTVQAASVFIDGQKYFLKRYNDKSFVYRLRNAFRKSRAVRTWFVSWEFLYRGLPVPEPILCLEERSFRFLKRSYILYEYVDNSMRLPQKWPLLDTQTRKSILIRLAIKLDWIHRTGGIHGDLKWNNLLIDENNNIYFIDFDGSRVSFPGKSQKIAKDLNRFLIDLSKFENDEGLKLIFTKVSNRSGIFF
jgi:tRNA A-37 threonylcarbamoyl transferase component Bud32